MNKKVKIEDSFDLEENPLKEKLIRRIFSEAKNRVKSIFRRDICVAKNTHQADSVEFVRILRTNN